MIDNSLVADIYENEQPNAEIEEDDVEIEVPDFVSLGLGGGEDGFSPIVSLSKTGRVTTLEITDKNGKQTTKIYDGYSPIKGIDYVDGYTPIKGVDYFDGRDGVTPHLGTNGNWWIEKTDTGVRAKGDKGDPYTLTEADKAEMVAEVISALPKYTGEVESV